MSLPSRPSRPRLLEPVWPMPSFEGRAPIALPADPKSAGLDLAYADVDRDPFVPDALPAFAVGDGVITYAGKQLHGFAVVVDHRNGWASYYANLGHLFAKPTNRGSRSRPERVQIGDVLGHVGAPLPDARRCLHFELWKLGAEGHFEPVDVLPIMQSWLLLPWQHERVAPSRPSSQHIAA